VKSVDLKLHYGWQTYHTDADSITDAAKAAVRASHEFLTADNHRMEIDGENVVVIRACDAQPPAIAPAWARPGFRAGAVWFSTPFREPLCEDCPSVGYSTDKTRCEPCPRRAIEAQAPGRKI
jgi:hypothetical protein